MQTIIAFSNRRWGGSYQQPHHLLSHLARRWQVIFIEEPMASTGPDELEVFEPAPGVEVWRLHTIRGAAGFDDGNLAATGQLVAAEAAERGIADYWTWFYTPLALPAAAGLSPRGIVYDCMGDPSHTGDVPLLFTQRENALFKVADLVFTGSQAAYDAKRTRHPDVHLFPPGMDKLQVAAAMAELISQADELVEGTGAVDAVYSSLYANARREAWTSSTTSSGAP